MCKICENTRNVEELSSKKTHHSVEIDIWKDRSTKEIKKNRIEDINVKPIENNENKRYKKWIKNKSNLTTSIDILPTTGIEPMSIG